LRPSDGACSVVRAPGSADALVRALAAAVDSKSPPELVAGALRVLAKVLLCNLGAGDGSPPVTDEALAQWRAAARCAGALPVLRRVMEAWQTDAQDVGVYFAAVSAALLELLPEEPGAAAAKKPGAAAAKIAGTAESERLERWQQDDPVLPEILLEAFHGEPARVEPRSAHAARGACRLS
jgi:hypothetical protein